MSLIWWFFVPGRPKEGSIKRCRSEPMFRRNLLNNKQVGVAVVVAVTKIWERVVMVLVDGPKMHLIGPERSI